MASANTTKALPAAATNGDSVVIVGAGLAGLGDIANRSPSELPLAMRNRSLTAWFIAAGALQREESRGSQFRSDYPESREEWARRSTLNLEDLEAIGENTLNLEHHQGNVIRVAFAQ